MLAYYSVAAAQEFWNDHWGGQTLDELLAIARRSPLTSLVTGALPANGLVLEAGCGRSDSTSSCSVNAAGAPWVWTEASTRWPPRGRRPRHRWRRPS